MAALRRRLRCCVAIWLFCQTASLVALVPQDCCASHRHREAHAAPPCHQAAEAAEAATTYCPLHSAGGAPCPMHRAAGHDAGMPDDDCVLRGVCNAPAAALRALLWSPGVLVDSLSSRPEALVVPAPRLTGERPVSLLLPPDAPPPRG
jgi:hypothetical protein